MNYLNIGIIGKTDLVYIETGLVKIFFDINKMNN